MTVELEEADLDMPERDARPRPQAHRRQRAWLIIVRACV